MSLCSWHILQLRVVCYLISFTISHGNFTDHSSCLHDYRYGPLVSVRFQMNYLLFCLQDQRQYQYYCQSPNCSTHYSKLTSLFTLLLLWCSAVENSSGLHFSVYTLIILLSIVRVTSLLNNDHLNMIDAC